MPDPTGRISHQDEFHRGHAWKRPCRVATTANITISTALNAGDTIDGVTLAAGDRVLVKDQGTGSQNGIYVAGVTPIRDFDMDQDLTTSVPAEEVMGAIVYVIAGTTNGGTLWRATNTTAPTLGSTTISFAQITSGSGSALTVKDEGTNLDTAVTSIDFVGAGVTATNVSHAVTVTIPTASLTLDDLTDVTITSATTGDRLRFDGSVWANSALIWTPLTVYDGTNWMLLVDGDGNAIMAEA